MRGTTSRMPWRVTPLQKRQLFTFVLAWLAYASTYLLRKPLGVIKTDLQNDLLFTETQLGWFDSALLLPYALMQMFLGPLGDKYGTRRALATCLVLSALSMIGFGHFSNFFMFCILLFLNGTAQAITWPCSVKALASWYPPQTRNSVMGMFGTNAFVGGIVGTALAVYFQDCCGWKSVYFIPSIVVLIMGIIVYLVLHSPEELNITIPDRPSEESLILQGKTNKPSWIQLWKIPGVAEIAFAMFCLKAVRYSLYMWLPMYLLEEAHLAKAEAGLFSTVFEVGGVVGSVAIGFLIDGFFRGHTLAGVAMSALIATLSAVAFFFTFHLGIIFSTIFLLMAGAFNCGPDTILGSSVPMELGEADGRGSGTAVIGLVNGFGSIGTCLEGPILGLIIQCYKWNGMALALICLSALGTACCWRASSIHAHSAHISNSIEAT